MIGRVREIAIRLGARKAVRPLRRRLPGSRVRWGNLRRTRPFCGTFGSSRGTPVDRLYIDRFLTENAGAIRGRVMEVKEPLYAARHAAGVTSTEVVDIDADNPLATLVADLCEPGSLPAGAYDAVVLTQTLHLLRHPKDALRNMWDSLTPGGTLLLTAPTASMLNQLAPGSEFHRWTPDGMRALLEDTLPEAEARVESHGNVLAMVAFLMGISLEELRLDELTLNDPWYPLVVCAAVRRPAAG